MSLWHDFGSRFSAIKIYPIERWSYINTIQKKKKNIFICIVPLTIQKANISFSFISRTFLCIIIFLAATQYGLVHSVVASSVKPRIAISNVSDVSCADGVLMRPFQLYKLKLKICTYKYTNIRHGQDKRECQYKNKEPRAV